MENQERGIIGIDPGSASGNICLLTNDNEVEIIPFKDYTLREWGEMINAWQCQYDIEAVCESVHGMPGMNVAAISSFMKNVGSIEMILAYLEIPTRYVTPQSWMKFYGVKKDKAETKTEWKKRLREVLQQRLPNVKCRTEEADAVLIALYGRCTRQ